MKADVGFLTSSPTGREALKLAETIAGYKRSLSFCLVLGHFWWDLNQQPSEEAFHLRVAAIHRSGILTRRIRNNGGFVSSVQLSSSRSSFSSPHIILRRRSQRGAGCLRAKMHRGCRMDFQLQKYDTSCTEMEISVLTQS